MQRNQYIGRAANAVTQWSGSIGAIVAVIFSIVVFLFVGLVWGFSDAYQLIWNTFMSAVSYLMLFIIQHTQNHEQKAIQLKLDEVIRAIQKADNALINIEEMDEETLSALREFYRRHKEASSKS